MSSAVSSTSRVTNASSWFFEIANENPDVALCNQAALHGAMRTALVSLAVGYYPRPYGIGAFLVLAENDDEDDGSDHLHLYSCSLKLVSPASPDKATLTVNMSKEDPSRGKNPIV